MKTPVDQKPTSNEAREQRCSPDDTNVEPGYSFLNEVARLWPVIDDQPGALPEQTLWLNRYRKRQVLGQGGFGVVYLAEDITLHRLVALKIARHEVLEKPEYRKRFQREAITAASLDHPNIVSVFDAGEQDGIGYITCAYCPGIDLGRWLAQQPGPVPPLEAAGFMRKIAQAVAYLHTRGLVHHDLKPANILLTQEGVSQIDEQAVVIPLNLTQAHPRLTDFGLAQFVNIARESLVGGTPTYMAPEQSRSGQQVGPAADVFSLGAILYELLTGKPYRSSPAVLNDIQISLGHNPFEDEACRAIPENLLAIVQKCVAVNPGERYADAGLLVSALEAYLNGSADRRAWRFSKTSTRERLINWTIMSTMFLLILWFSWGRDLWNSRAANTSSFDPVQYALVIKQASDALARQEYDIGLGMLNRYATPEFAQKRGFTWNLLRSQLSHEAGALTRRELAHDAPLRSFTFSPDRKFFLTTDSNGDCIVTEYATSLTTLRFNCKKTPRTAIASPDGQTLVVLCDGTPAKPTSSIQWRDRATGKLLAETSSARWGYTQAAFTPDGKFLAVGAHATNSLTEGAVELWDVQKRTLIATLTSAAKGHGILGALVISPDGERLYAGTTEPAIEVWDIRQRKLISKWKELRQAVCQLAISSDGRYLASFSSMPVTSQQFDPSSRDNRIVVWDTRKSLVCSIHPGPASNVFPVCLAFSPLFPELLFIGVVNGPICCFNVITSKVCEQHNVDQFLGFFASFTPDGRRILIKTAGSNLLTWAPAALDALANSTIREIWSLAASPDGQTLAVAADDENNPEQQCFYLLDANTASTTRWSQRAHDATVTKVIYSPDGKFIYTTGLDQTVKCWDATHMKVIWSQTAHNARGIRTASLSIDGKILATAGVDSQVICWEAATGRLLAQVRFGDTNSHVAIAFHPSRPWIAMVSKDKMQVWNYRDQDVIFAANNLGYLECLTFDQKGEKLYLGGLQPIIHIWNTASRVFQGTLTSSSINALTISPDQKTIVASTSEGALQFWYAPTGQELGMIRTPAGQIKTLCFSPDGRTLYAASRENHLFLWRVPK